MRNKSKAQKSLTEKSAHSILNFNGMRNVFESSAPQNNKRTWKEMITTTKNLIFTLIVSYTDTKTFEIAVIFYRNILISCFEALFFISNHTCREWNRNEIYYIFINGQFDIKIFVMSLETTI